MTMMPGNSGHGSIDPHRDRPVLLAGPRPEAARATLVLLHGRGALAEGMIDLYEAIGVDGLAAVAPAAYGNTWYPRSFRAPIESNQPHLDSALGKVDRVIRDLMARGVESGRIALLGFSQGACLASEYVARYPRRYGAVMALTGGLIGPAGTPRDYAGSLAGTPVFLGTSDPDPHVPVERVLETERVLSGMGARVEVRRYAGLPHTINEEELDICRKMLAALNRGAQGAP